MFFPSPRNTVEAMERMLDELKVDKFVTPSHPFPIIAETIRKRTMQHEIAPSQDMLLDESYRTPSIPFCGDLDALRFKPLIHLHTSGSTGFPKVVTLKHGFAAAIDAYQTLADNPMERYMNSRMFIPFPAFHVAGINHSLTAAIWSDSTAVLPPPGVPITAQLIHAVHVNGRVTCSFLAPSLLDDIVKNEEYAQGLGRLDSLSFSGGPCSEETFAIVSRHTSIHSTMGATEYGGLPTLPKDPEDYNYVRFNEFVGIELRETVQSGLYELVFNRHEPARNMQPIFITFPDLDEYRTKDCFSKHPSKPDLWKFQCRLDDVIVMSNGEKFNPVQSEGIISTCHDISGCLIFGQGRFELGMLAERKNPEQDSEDVIRSLTPFLQRANQLAPAYAKIGSDHVIFTSPGMSLPRASKGTIQRAQANKQFQSDIDRFYARLEKMEDAPRDEAGLDFSSLETLQRTLLEYMSPTLASNEKSLGLRDDLFASGLDSLQVMTLTRAINSTAGGPPHSVEPSAIYENPTVEKLSVALWSGSYTVEYSDFDRDTSLDKSTWESMEFTFRRMKEDVGVDGHHNLSRSWSARILKMLKSTEPPLLYQPDGGRVAWLQVLGSFLVNFNNWGLVNSFGVFQAFYEMNYLSAYTSAQIAWIGTLQGALLLLVGSSSGPLFDQGFFGAILVIAGLGIVFGLMMLSLATRYYEIMLTQGVLLGLCSGLLYIPSVALIPLYFKAKRGLALGLATAGGSAGGVVYPVVFRALLNSLGFGWATRIMGFLALCTLTIAWLLIKPVGARSTRQIFDPSAFSDLPYVCCMISGVFLFAGLLVPFFLCTTYALDVLSIDVDLSFNLLAVLNGAQFVGRIVPAFLSDWVGPEIIIGCSTLVAGLLGFCWIAVHNTAGYIAWLTFYGLASGAIVTLPAIVLPYICPSMSVIGTRMGMVYGASGIGFLISSPVALALNAQANGFLGSQLWIGACCLLGLIVYALPIREARNRRTIYEDNGGLRRPYLIRRPKQQQQVHVDHPSSDAAK